MKLRRLLAAATAATVAASVVTVTSHAANKTAIDFENGNYNGISMMVNDSGADDSALSVVDFNGSKMLKVDRQTVGKNPKVYFNVADFVGANNLAKITSISLDLIFEAPSGSTPGWIGGAVGSQGGAAKTPAWSQAAYDGGEYNNQVSPVIKVTKEI